MNEIQSLMPTAKWDRPQQLFGYIEEEEVKELVPLLGNALYQWLLEEYDRLRDPEHGLVDITATTVRPTGKAKIDPKLAYSDVTERLEQIERGEYREIFEPPVPGEKEVSKEDMHTIKLLRICQQIEFYKMLAHKTGLLTVSFNEGGGMNVVSADGYDSADDKKLDRVTKDAYMSAGRSIDSLLLFLEADAKNEKDFTEKWKEAESFYLHKNLLFQTATVMNEYLDIKGERMAYVQLVRDIRFSQNTYIRPTIGNKLLKAVIAYANEKELSEGMDEEVAEELLDMLRTALAFFVESRRTELAPAREKLARRDSMTDAKQAMATACQFIEANLDKLGECVIDTPIYNAYKEQERKQEWARTHVEESAEKRRHDSCHQQQKKLFTAFPHVPRQTDTK